MYVLAPLLLIMIWKGVEKDLAKDRNWTMLENGSR